MKNKKTTSKKTKSICPECFKEINAEIKIKDNQVSIVKECPEHGTFKSSVETDPKFYFACKNSEQKKRTYQHFTLPITGSCNLNCRFCYYEKKGKDPDFSEIAALIERFTGEIITLSGGEPTLRNDLLKIIKKVKKEGKLCNLSTNGILLENFEYVKNLKKAGLDMVHLSLNSLEREKLRKHHGIDVLDKKLLAIKNLEKSGVLTRISFLMQDDNRGDLEEIIRFAGQHNNVHEIRIRTPADVGRYAKNKKTFVSEQLMFICNILNIEYEKVIKDLDRINFGKRECSLNIKTELIFSNKKIVTKKWRIIKGYPGIKTRSFRIIKKLIPKKASGRVLSIINNLEKKSFLKKKVGNTGLKKIEFGLRCWPDKNNVDLRLINECPSLGLDKNGKLIPFCYANICNEK